ncbi:MAG: hypothetical protein IJ455_07700 [Agathobacter sp.]|nr:hypothetical protein [Agathobacter sp.]
MDLKKMNKTAIITAVVLVVILSISIIALVVDGGKNIENQAGTESSRTDTTAPKADFAHRYVFTNDAANADFTGMFESIRDVSECTVKLVRFERSGNLGLMDEKALKSLTDKINTVASEEEMKAVGSEEIPTEEGIYRAVMEIIDAHGNAVYEEVVLILDKTGAKIEEAADKVVKVSKENLSAEPIVDKSEYEITDNVDGKIKADDIVCELELRDEAKHEWLVHVSYVDRAGNESKATFLITVQEDATLSTQTGSENTGNSGSSNNGGNTSNSGTTNNTGNGNTSNNGGTTNNGGNANTGNDSNSGNGSNTGNSTDNETDKEPVNNQDTSTWVPTEDENDISPSEQKAIDAGYGNVVKFDTGNYGVLMKSGDHRIDGKDGFDILDEYLASLGLCSSNMSGGWIDEDNDWYMYVAKDVHELITEDDEGYWDY